MHADNPYHSCTRSTLSVLISLCFALNAALDHLSYGIDLGGLSEPLTFGAKVTISPSRALTGPAAIWAQSSAQGHSRLKPLAVHLAAPPRVSAEDLHATLGRLSPVDSNGRPVVSMSQPRGRAPPSFA